jgi:hypothetical protein
VYIIYNYYYIRTYGGDDKHDEEGVEHGYDGGGECRDDVLEGLDPPEQPDYTANLLYHII